LKGAGLVLVVLLCGGNDAKKLQLVAFFPFFFLFFRTAFVLLSAKWLNSFQADAYSRCSGERGCNPSSRCVPLLFSPSLFPFPTASSSNVAGRHHGLPMRGKFGDEKTKRMFSSFFPPLFFFSPPFPLIG